MIETIDTLRVLIEQIVLRLDYLGIALVMTVTAPELVLPFAGFLVDRNQLSAPAVIAAGTLGALIGQTGIYLLAAWVGEGRVRQFLRRYGRWLLLQERDFDRALELFERYDSWFLVVGRFVPSVRSMISLPAGVAKMGLVRFIGLTFLGTAVWNTFLVYLGAALGRNWPVLLEFFATYETVVWVVLAGALGLFIVLRIRQRLVLRG
jgi:membrane protein DedA with SNARE-associated domain